MKKFAVILSALLSTAAIAFSAGCSDKADTSIQNNNVNSDIPITHPDNNKNSEEDFPTYKEVYLETVKELNGRYLDTEWTYGLVDIDGDETPELVANYPVTVSLYTYADGKAYPVMEEQGYGFTGNDEYMYLPGKNVIFNADYEMAGAIVYETYCKIGKAHSLENYHSKPLYTTNWKDINGDGTPDDNEISNKTYYFYGNDELTEEEFKAYRFGEGFNLLYGEMSYDEIVAELEK